MSKKSKKIAQNLAENISISSLYTTVVLSEGGRVFAKEVADFARSDRGNKLIERVIIPRILTSTEENFLTDAWPRTKAFWDSQPYAQGGIILNIMKATNIAIKTRDNKAFYNLAKTIEKIKEECATDIFVSTIVLPILKQFNLISEAIKTRNIEFVKKLIELGVYFPDSIDGMSLKEYIVHNHIKGELRAIIIEHGEIEDMFEESPAETAEISVLERAIKENNTKELVDCLKSGDRLPSEIDGKFLEDFVKQNCSKEMRKVIVQYKEFLVRRVVDGVEFSEFDPDMASSLGGGGSGGNGGVSASPGKKGKKSHKKKHKKTKKEDIKEKVSESDEESKPGSAKIADMDEDSDQVASADVTPVREDGERSFSLSSVVESEAATEETEDYDILIPLAESAAFYSYIIAPRNIIGFSDELSGMFGIKISGANVFHSDLS